MTRVTGAEGEASGDPGREEPSPARRDPAHEDHEDRHLLRGARAGDGDCVASLYDRHAGALYAFARGVLGEGTAAEDAVVDVMVDACGPRTTSPSHRSVRHALAVATYHRCASPGPLSVAARSRAVLGLCVHGEHTYREAAALTGVGRAPLGPLLLAEMRGRGLPLSA